MAYVSLLFERRHRSAQLVGLSARKPRPNNGNLHCLFLK
jgi:hypothetical protein